MSEIPETEEEWRQKLDEEEFKILRKAGTEKPGTGEYIGKDEEGVYHCRGCGAELFDSRTKFDDKDSRWPSFYDAVKENVEFEEDRSHGMNRVEVVCSNCGSHLGHVFEDGPEPTGKRFCINSKALDFEDSEQEK
jgi:peptide-methionine (R)-S-oxide reductase